MNNYRVELLVDIKAQSKGEAYQKAVRIAKALPNSYLGKVTKIESKLFNKLINGMEKNVS